MEFYICIIKLQFQYQLILIEDWSKYDGVNWTNIFQQNQKPYISIISKHELTNFGYFPPNWKRKQSMTNISHPQTHVMLIMVM